MTRRWIMMAMLAGIMLAGGCVEPEIGAPPYTLMLTRSAYPNVIEEEKLRATADTGWDDLYVIHENNVSILYRGHYDNYRDAKRARREVLRYEVYNPEVNQEVTVYHRVVIQCARGLDIGPPEWRLGTTETDQRWTLLVAQFYDQPEADYVGRERFAVEYCRELRQQGYDAYFYHAVGKSYVTLGNFPPEAYQMISERTTDMSYANRGMAMPYVFDPLLKAYCEKFPEMLTNGCKTTISEVTPDTGKANEYMEPSAIIEVPKVYNEYTY
jgi:hypothetical protein